MGTMNRRAGRRLVAALGLVVGAAGVLLGMEAAPSAWRPGSRPANARAGSSRDHVYRIIGRVRMLLFWVSANDVGGARVTWKGDENERVVSLLIGSDPRRAPREVNEWGYVREEVMGDAASVFGIRTITDGDSPQEADARRGHAGGLTEFGVFCSTVSRLDVKSRTATVHLATGATYRDLGGVLSGLPRDTTWNPRASPRPAGVAPGFLTALDELMRSSATSARNLKTVPAAPKIAYVYRDGVFDLIARGMRRVPRLQTATNVFQDLLRADLSIRNRRTGATQEFSVTYGIDGPLAGIPIRAQYQPNWWFRVELELDETGDAPQDPAHEPATRQLMHSLCDSLAD